MLIPGLVLVCPQDEVAILSSLYVPSATVVLSHSVNQPSGVIVAVATTEPSWVPPVNSNWTWVTSEEAAASSSTCVPETVVPFDGSTTLVLRDAAVAASPGTRLTAAAIASAPT